MPVRIKRVYDTVEGRDGYRVLIDRLWPRGVKKEELLVQEWLKDIAPSDELRAWFDHDPDKFSEFERRYREELTEDTPREHLRQLLLKCQSQTVTLVYAARNRAHNNAVVLKKYLEEMMETESG